MKRQLKTGINLLTISLMLSGCASLPWNWHESTDKQIKNELAAAKQSSSIKHQGVPQNVANALLPPLQVELPSEVRTRLEPRFDVSVNNARARDVFANLVEGTPYNVIVDSDVDSRISAQLKNVTLLEAFDTISRNYGFDFERRNNQFFVYGANIRTRVFNVNHLNLVRAGKSTTQVSSGGIGDSGSQVNVETSQEDNFWKQLDESLKTLVGTEEGKKVIANPQTGLVIVSATARELRIVDDFINSMHMSMGRQVILEAKILEVELNDSYQSGVNWAGLLTRNNGAQSLGVGQIGGGTLIGGGASDIAGFNTPNLTGATVSDPSGGTTSSTSAFGGIISFALNVSNFGVFVELLSRQGDVHVLSSPRVSTVNNQKAVIKVGGDEFYVTGITSGTQASGTGGSTQTAPTIELESFFSGITLDVTPQIDDEENITLHLHPTVSEVLQGNKSFVVEGKAFDIPLAKSTIREADNILRAKNGQIIVVGGLMKEGTTDEEASVPFLGKLPLIGNLFKHKKVVRIKKELVIMVKPTIVDSKGYWSADAAKSMNRFADLER